MPVKRKTNKCKGKRCKQCKTSRCGHLKRRRRRSSGYGNTYRKQSVTKQRQRQKQRRNPKQYLEEINTNEPIRSYSPGETLKNYTKRFGMTRFGGRSRSRFGEQYPLLVAPFGPPRPWLEEGPSEGAASSSLPPPRGMMYGLRSRRRRRYGFGNESPPPQNRSLSDRYVNSSGYLSLWNGHPKPPPPSWNPYLMNGSNYFRVNSNYPTINKII